MHCTKQCGLWTRCEIILRWMSRHLINMKSTLIQIVVVSQQAITWGKVYQGPCRHMASLGHNESRYRCSVIRWSLWCDYHYNDVIKKSAMASQITSVSMGCSTICSGAEPRKHASKLRVTGLCKGNPPVTRSRNACTYQYIHKII